jgi:glutathione S-transferase
MPMLGRARSRGCSRRSTRWSRRSSTAALARIFERDQPCFEHRLKTLDDSIRARLGDLSARLGTADWLDGAFSAGDLLMVSVLRRLQGSGLFEDYPNLAAYVVRGEARPAFKRAFAAQLAVFTAASATDKA